MHVDPGRTLSFHLSDVNVLQYTQGTNTLLSGPSTLTHIHANYLSILFKGSATVTAYNFQRASIATATPRSRAMRAISRHRESP